MAARRKTGRTGKRAANRLRRVGIAVVAAGVLFGAGVGLGAWMASGPDQPARAGVEIPTTPGPAARPAARSTARPADTSAAMPAPVPLPVMAALSPPPATVEPFTPRAVAVKPATPLPKPAPQPAWKRNAVAVDVPAGAPMIAVVLDDIGVDKRRSARAVALPGPLTMAYLPYADDLQAQTAEARRRGHELLVHMPMQPKGHNSDPGPNVLDMRLGAIEVLSRIEWNLSQFTGYVGVNNHMGSLFTESEEGMRLVAESLRDRGLLFLDSLTSPRSVGTTMADAFAVPNTTRDVFLDNTDTQAEVEMRLAQTERVARKVGTAIAIGHPRDATIAVLQRWIPRAREQGFALVPLSRVLEVRRQRTEQQASRP